MKPHNGVSPSGSSIQKLCCGSGNACRAAQQELLLFQVSHKCPVCALCCHQSRIVVKVAANLNAC